MEEQGLYGRTKFPTRRKYNQPLWQKLKELYQESGRIKQSNEWWMRFADREIITEGYSDFAYDEESSEYIDKIYVSALNSDEVDNEVFIWLKESIGDVFDDPYYGFTFAEDMEFKLALSGNLDKISPEVISKQAIMDNIKVVLSALALSDQVYQFIMYDNKVDTITEQDYISFLRDSIVGGSPQVFNYLVDVLSTIKDVDFCMLPTRENRQRLLTLKRKYTRMDEHGIKILKHFKGDWKNIPVYRLICDTQDERWLSETYQLIGWNDILRIIKKYTSRSIVNERESNQSNDQNFVRRSYIDF